MTNSFKLSSNYLSPLLVNKLPSKKAWLVFLDKLLLSVGTITLLLALVFFVAYNWDYMDKIGKFVLVESALIISVAGYVLLAYWRKFLLGQKLLLLVASIITGSLLALIGQVYQTGADTWQLFFSWMLLIIPFVVIARLPALWLLWLGLINISVHLFLQTTNLWFDSYDSQVCVQVIVLSLLNFVAVNLWLLFAKNEALVGIGHTNHHNRSIPYHWSTYIVGIISISFATLMGLFNTNYYADDMFGAITLVLWVLVIFYFCWYFYKKHTDVLMLTYVAISCITVVMALILEYADLDYDAGSFLFLAIILIGMSSFAITVLLRIHKQQSSKIVEQDKVTPTDDEAGYLEHLMTVDADESEAKKRISTILDNNSPWFIQIFLGISGLFSGALVFVFFVLSIGIDFDDFVAQIIMGTILLAVSFTLFNANKHEEHAYLNSLSLSLSIAGQVFILFYLVGNIDSLLQIVSIILLLHVVLLIIMPNFFHRLLSALIALGCLVWLLSYVNIPEVSAGLLAFIACVFNLQGDSLLRQMPSRFKQPSKSNNAPASVQIIQALGLVSIFVLLVITVFFISAENNHRFIGSYHEFYYHYALAQSILIAACLYATYVIFRRYGISLISKTGVVVMAAVVLLGIVSIYVSGLLATSLTIAIGFFKQKRLIVTLGIIALVGYIFWYYYQLDTSLLVKSGSMLAAGVVIFAIRWGLVKNFSEPKLRDANREEITS